LDRLKAERRSLDEQIVAAESAATMRSIDPTAVADVVLTQLRQMVQNVKDMPTFAMRQLLASVVGKVVIDMETKAAEVQMMIPLNEIFWGGRVDGNAMRPVGRSASSASDETHPVIRVNLGKFDCAERRAARRLCYDCRRRAA
jgi:hypothetical protein